MKHTYFFVVLIFLIVNSARSQSTDLLFRTDSVEIYKSAAIFMGKVIYNANDDLKRLVTEEETEACKVDYAFRYNPLSLIGNYYSYEAWEGGTVACGVPGSTFAIQTIDLRNGNSISLTQLFTKESIFEAIRSDKWIREIGEEANVDMNALNNLDDLIKIIYRLRNVKFTASSFAILEYAKTKGMVAVRFVGREYVGFGHHKHLQLGLLVRPTAKFREELEGRTYFFLGEYNNGLIRN